MEVKIIPSIKRRCTLKTYGRYPFTDEKIPGIQGGYSKYEIHLGYQVYSIISQLMNTGIFDFYYFINKDSDFAFARLIIDCTPNIKYPRLNIHIYVPQNIKDGKYKRQYANSVKSLATNYIETSIKDVEKLLDKNKYFVPIYRKQEEDKRHQEFKKPKYKDKEVYPIMFNVNNN